MTGYPVALKRCKIKHIEPGKRQGKDRVYDDQKSSRINAVTSKPEGIQKTFHINEMVQAIAGDYQIKGMLKVARINGRDILLDGFHEWAFLAYGRKRIQ